MRQMPTLAAGHSPRSHPGNGPPFTESQALPSLLQSATLPREQKHAPSWHSEGSLRLPLPAHLGLSCCQIISSHCWQLEPQEQPPLIFTEGPRFCHWIGYGKCQSSSISVQGTMCTKLCQTPFQAAFPGQVSWPCLLSKRDSQARRL